MVDHHGLSVEGTGIQITVYKPLFQKRGYSIHPTLSVSFRRDFIYQSILADVHARGSKTPIHRG